MGDQRQNPRMRGQEGPAGHLNRLPDSGKYLLVSRFGYSVAVGTGRRPAAAASFPGLPEERCALARSSRSLGPMTLTMTRPAPRSCGGGAPPGEDPAAGASMTR